MKWLNNRDGVLEDCPRARGQLEPRGPKIVALASNRSGLGLGLDASASSHRSVINVLNLSYFYAVWWRLGLNFVDNLCFDKRFVVSLTIGFWWEMSFLNIFFNNYDHWPWPWPWRELALALASKTTGPGLEHAVPEPIPVKRMNESVTNSGQICQNACAK